MHSKIAKSGNEVEAYAYVYKETKPSNLDILFYISKLIYSLIKVFIFSTSSLF